MGLIKNFNLKSLFHCQQLDKYNLEIQAFVPGKDLMMILAKGAGL